jgi:CRP-like cAMP-binding protein
MKKRPATRDDIAQIPLFEPLFGQDADKSIPQKLADCGLVRSWNVNNVVFAEGDPADSIFALLSGRAKVVLQDEDGDEELILAILRPKSVVGELAPLDAAPRSASLITLDDCVLLEIQRKAFVDAVKSSPQLSHSVHIHQSRTVRDADEQLRTICMYDRHGQTVRRLYLFSERVHAPEQVVLSDCPQIQQLAQMLGCHRRKISTALSELEEGRFISTRRHGNNQLLEVILTKKAINKYLKGLHSRIP